LPCSESRKQGLRVPSPPGLHRVCTFWASSESARVNRAVRLPKTLREACHSRLHDSLPGNSRLLAHRSALRYVYAQKECIGIVARTVHRCRARMCAIAEHGHVIVHWLGARTLSKSGASVSLMASSSRGMQGMRTGALFYLCLQSAARQCMANAWGQRTARRP
jgi:hypothetical protein